MTVETGKGLFDKAVEYLEINEFYQCDRNSAHFSSGNENGWARIYLYWDSSQLTLTVQRVASSQESPEMKFSGDFEEVKQVLDVLMFVIKEGEASD